MQHCSGVFLYHGTFISVKSLRSLNSLNASVVEFIYLKSSYCFHVVPVWNENSGGGGGAPRQVKHCEPLTNCSEEVNLTWQHSCSSAHEPSRIWFWAVSVCLTWSLFCQICSSETTHYIYTYFTILCFHYWCIVAAVWAVTAALYIEMSSLMYRALLVNRMLHVKF